jgi:hypothetical protein
VAHLRCSPRRSNPSPLLLLVPWVAFGCRNLGSARGGWDLRRPEFSRGGTPAFVWPADRTWCVAADIDPHWAGIGASSLSIKRLIADRRLDAVEADPADEQPAYR